MCVYMYMYVCIQQTGATAGASLSCRRSHGSFFFFLFSSHTNLRQPLASPAAAATGRFYCRPSRICGSRLRFTRHTAERPRKQSEKGKKGGKKPSA